MYSEGIERLTVYGSSNIESKLQKKMHEGVLYSVYFCENDYPLFKDSELDKKPTVDKVLEYLDYRFAIVDFVGSKGACKISLVNTDYTIKIVSFS